MRLALLAAPLLLASCVSPTPSEIASAQRGHDEAVADLAHGRARFAFIGLLRDDQSALDSSTGLVRFSVGCCKSHERIAYRDEYNDEVDAARSSGRLSALTLERKATTRAAVESLFASSKGTPLAPGGAPVASPGGRFRVEVAPGIGRDALALWSTDTTTGERAELRYVGSGPVRVLFSPDGETLFSRDDAVRAYATFDLPRALFLEVFPDPRPDR